MTVLGKLPNGFLLVEEAVAGPASYSAGARPTIVFSDLQQAVEQVLAIFADDARIALQNDLTGRTLTYEVRGQPGALSVNDGLPEVADTTDLSLSTYRALAYGR